MYLGDVWYTVDDKPIYESFIPKPVSESILRKLSSDVWQRRYAWSSNVRWKHIWMGECSWRQVVRTNTDATLKKKDKTWDQCDTCRGKGHPWKCEVWNGKPFIITKYKNGYADTSKIDWKNPDWCRECDGTGTK